MTESPLLFLGFGFCANSFLYHKNYQAEIMASYRQPDKKNLLLQKNITPLLFGSDALSKAMIKTNIWVVSIPPRKEDDNFPDDVFCHHQKTIDATALEKNILYLSTTGSYGDHQGNWVDETTPPAPTNHRTQKRLKAETAWRHLGATIFRLGGIYGARIDGMGQESFHAILSGRAKRIEKKGQVFGRIHVYDIAEAIHLWLKKLPNHLRGEVFNLVDDCPENPRVVLDYAYELLQQPLPPLTDFETAKNTLSPMVQSFYQDNKRVKNEKIKKQLGLKFRYDNYKKGLTDIFHQCYQKNHDQL